jgi:hypothetical protein
MTVGPSDRESTTGGAVRAGCGPAALLEGSESLEIESLSAGRAGLRCASQPGSARPRRCFAGESTGTEADSMKMPSKTPPTAGVSRSENGGMPGGSVTVVVAEQAVGGFSKMRREAHAREAR